MKERAITMDVWSVRATLDGLKTQMRVPVKLREFGPSETRGYDWRFRDRILRWNDFTTKQLLSSKSCPVHVGDRLWVREAFALGSRVVDPDPDDEDDWVPTYRANGDERPWLTSLDEDAEEVPPPWRSPVLMPRWVSRVTLEVTEVRLQRLLEITEDDAVAEGVRISDAATAKQDTIDTHGMTPYRGAFACLWDSINGKRALWSSNPWVWSYTFRRVP